MNASPSQNRTAVALRQALGPGYGFAGPSERVLSAAVRSLDSRPTDISR